ncbi:MAG: hypothetical protein U0797_26315 [Gemmataceae bacterium]
MRPLRLPALGRDPLVKLIAREAAGSCSTSAAACQATSAAPPRPARPRRVARAGKDEVMNYLAPLLREFDSVGGMLFTHDAVTAV